MIKRLLAVCALLPILSTAVLAQQGSVAILDIDEVAKQLGVEEQVRVDLLKKQDELNAQIQSAQTTLQDQMNGVEQAAGENPTEEQRRNIIVTNQQLNAEFNNIRARANQALAEERVRLITDFQAKVRPIAEQAAKNKGFSVVLMKISPPVFTNTPDADITAETIKLAKEAGLEVKVEVVPVKQGAEAAPAAAPAAGN